MKCITNYTKHYTECIGWVGGKVRQKRRVFEWLCFKMGKQVQVWRKRVQQVWGSDIKSPMSYGSGSIQSLGVTGCEQLSI